MKYCNGAETFYTYDPQRGKAGGQMAHTNTYGTDTGKKFQLANVKDVIGDFASYGSDPRRTQYAGSETDGLSVDYKGKYTQQLQVIKDNYAIFAVSYNGEDNDYMDGEVVQHIEYVPFGEVFVEERNNIWNTPYLFNAKEFHEETGLYYYESWYRNN